jgi:hypothetical protein
VTSADRSRSSVTGDSHWGQSLGTVTGDSHWGPVPIVRGTIGIRPRFQRVVVPELAASASFDAIAMRSQLFAAEEPGPYA